jgi:hypothetical protein
MTRLDVSGLQGRDDGEKRGPSVKRDFVADGPCVGSLVLKEIRNGASGRKRNPQPRLVFP